MRHSCVESNRPRKINLEPSEIDNLKNAAAKFVCLDFRSFYALDCSGLRDLVVAGFELGKKCPTMKNSDFLEQFSSRKTVKSCVADEAIRAKIAIKELFKESIKQGGFGCILDLGSERFHSNTYLAMIANVFLLRDDCIKHKRVIFHMGLIGDLVKTKGVIKKRIIEVFAEFDINEQEMKSFVTFTTDR